MRARRAAAPSRDTHTLSSTPQIGRSPSTVLPSHLLIQMLVPAYQLSACDQIAPAYQLSAAIRRSITPSRR